MHAATVTTRFRVKEGCLDCAGDVGGFLRQLRGVVNVAILSTAGVIVVEHDGSVSPRAVIDQAARAGVGIEPAEQKARERRKWWQQPKLIALGVAAVGFLAGLLAEKALEAEFAARVVYVVSTIIGGFYPAISGLRALRTGRLTISSLLVVAAGGAIALGVHEEAALLVVVFSLGEVLEEYVTDRARGSIRALMELAPPTAQRIKDDGFLETVAVELLHPGALVLIRPGERIPTDGEVIEGRSSVDQSPITGESIPVEVGEGVGVFAGTINGNGALRVRVTKEYADTTLSRVIKQVQEAQEHKGRTQRFADRFGAIYTPIMFVVAALVAVAPPLFGGEFREWLYRGLVVLTVSCSCGLVISVPVAVVAAVTRAARDGVLVKGGAYLEALAKIRAIAFDKTGTLTQGRPEVTDVLPLNGVSPDDVLRLAATVEAASEHPLAGAIVSAAEHRGLKLMNSVSANAIPGVGVEATIEGDRVFVGKLGRISAASDSEASRHFAKLESEGKTAVVVANDGKPLGVLAVADKLRPHASEVISSLRRLGFKKVVMLTGDNERVGSAIAGSIGIEDCRAGLLPEDKTRVVQSLRREHGGIAMVGDGVNDAPALAASNIGIAMGVTGTDVALETADVALMADDLMKLPYAIQLSRRALFNIYQNIVLSLAVVAVLVTAALGGWLSLTSGLLLNEGAALLIITNGLRLLRRKEAMT